MSWDPNQPPSGPNPNPAPNPYGQPSQNPYEQPSQYAPPQNPYGQPQNPFGAPGPGQPQVFGYAPPQAAPLPLGQAIQGLPNQYIKIVTKPGVQSFAEEQGKAEWGIIWLQLIFLGLVGTIVGLLRIALNTAISFGLSGGSSSALASNALAAIFAGSASTFSIVFVVIGFFIVVGVQYLLAKAFKGTGDFKQQGYAYLLFYVPITVVSYLIGLIPILGGFVGWALGIYALVLNVFSIMSVHRLSGGKATAVVLIPIAAIFLLVLLCGLVLVLLFAAALNGAR